MKTPKELYQQHDRIWKAANRNAQMFARKVHPETGGNGLLVHNWGNAEAKAAWQRFWDRINKIRKVYKAAYDKAEHIEHLAKGFHPIWCKYCRR